MNTGKQRMQLGIPLALIVGGIVLLAFAWYIAMRPTQDSEDVANNFILKMEPALKEFDNRNNTAADKAISNIAEEMDGYREKIKPFVDDITGWGTRFGVIGRSSGDLWQKWWAKSDNTNAARDYISSKFDKHLFSDAKVSAMVERAFQQFQDDLAASQNLLLADVETALQDMGLQNLKIDVLDTVRQTNQRAHEKAQRMAVDSLRTGTAVFVGSEILGIATGLIVTRVAAGIAASTATTTASSGGATAAGTATGGAGGSTVGPAGTVIGAGVGLVVGFVIDWWMTGKLEERLTRECEDMIANAKSQIITGTCDEPGLEHVFRIAASAVSDEGKASVTNAIWKAMK